MQVSPRTRSLDHWITAAAAVLAGEGWAVDHRQVDVTAVWHLMAHKRERWRVVQVVPPATAPAERQERRALLGDAVRMPTRAGTMEQWLVHVRPDGRASFGTYVLHSQRWIRDEERPWDSAELLGRPSRPTVAGGASAGSQPSQPTA